MEPEKRRALTLPARLNKRTSLKRDAPSIWELQDALRNGMYRDPQDDLASDTASVSEASVRDSDLASVDGSSGSWQLPPGVYAAAAGDRAGGSWPRIRKQRTPQGAMSIWEVNEALGNAQPPGADPHSSADVQNDVSFVDAILGSEAAPPGHNSVEPPLAVVMEGAPTMPGGHAPLPEVTRMESNTLLELGADLKRTSLGSEEQLGSDMAGLPPLRAVNTGGVMGGQQQLGTGSAELDALAQLDALAAEEALEQSGKEGAMVDPSELLAILETPGDAGWIPGISGNHFGGPSPPYMRGNVAIHDNAGPPLQMHPGMGPASPGFSAALPGGGMELHDGMGGMGFQPPPQQAVPGNYGMPAPYPAPMPHATPAVAQQQHDPFERALGGRHSTRNGPERKEWTPVEDSIIREGVLQHGCRWRKIAMMLPGRSDDAVRNRWNRLRESSGDEFVDVPIPQPRRRAPNARKAGAQEDFGGEPPQQGHRREHSGGAGRAERVSWTRAEDAIIVNSVQELGHKWFQIAQRLPGRTDHAIRNRYHRLQAMVEDAQLMRQQQDFTPAEEFAPEVAPSGAGQSTCSSQMEHDPSSSPPMQLAW